MSRVGWLAAFRSTARRRRRHLASVVALAVVSTALLVIAAFVDGYRQDVMVNVGAGLLMVIATYAIFNPLFAELQTANIREHPKLDQSAFIQHIAGARASVSIMETWTGLLDPQFKTEFLTALRSALARDVTVRLLLLDPDSAATEQRAEELPGRDVRRSIMENLRDLVWFQRRDLTDAMRERLTIRIYSASPAVQLYRWDDKAFISFFPVGELAYDTPQLEAYLATPWGEFVLRKFDELWNDPKTRPLSHYLALPVTVIPDGGTPQECDIEFVRLEDDRYVAGQTLLKHVIRTGRAGLVVRWNQRDHRLHDADDDPDTYRQVVDLFTTKYGSRRDAIMRLVPTGGPG